MVVFRLGEAYSCRIKIVVENFFWLWLRFNLLFYDNAGRFLDSFIRRIGHALVLLYVCSPLKIGFSFFVAMVELELAILRVVFKG